MADIPRERGVADRLVGVQAAVSRTHDAAVEPLTGFTVGITAARRREEFGVALERRGATVRYAPAIRIVPLLDDTELLAATKECLAAPLDLAVATTGIGYRGWVEAAGTWGLGEDLLAALGRANVLTRGPKVRGAVRASGLREAWSPDSESSDEVVEHLLELDLVGKRIAVQLHGEPTPGMIDALVDAGAQVIEVPVYRWVPPADVEPLRQLLAAVVAREVDAVAFTSAPASTNFLRTADEQGVGEQVRTALRTDVVVACVGTVTAAPFTREDIPVIAPDRFRLGALVREIVVGVPAQRSQRFLAGGVEVEVRGHGAVVDGEFVALEPAPTAVLRRLSLRPGEVVGRDALLEVLPGGGDDEDAVEVALTRLRTALGHPAVISTVGERGYRLATG